jgi:SAM-dependent methyltransferase
MNPLNIFISWSGPTSHEIAETLDFLLSKVFENNVECWLSKKIPAGGDWYAAIKDALHKADFGVICFTPENIDSPWLMFEGGALVSSILAKGQHEDPVCPYLFGVSSEQIPKPIYRWQAVTADYEGTKNLLKSINSRLATQIYPGQFDTLFEASWEKCRSKFPTVNPTRAMIGQLLDTTRSSTGRISSELQVATNPANQCAGFLFVKACQGFFSNFTVTDGFVNFTAPANTYPDHLLLLLEKFKYPVKAIALVDVEEKFWGGFIGKEIYKKTPEDSERVFVFSDRDKLEKNFDSFLRHARHYNAYAMSRANLDRIFEAYAYDFSIIGAETKILAKYVTTDNINSILFTTNPESIKRHEKAFDEIISKSIKMTADHAERLIKEDDGETNSPQKKSFIESVFAKMTPLSNKSIEMSAYVSVKDYAQFEEQHAYFIDMMEMMLDNFNESRDAEKTCRVLELGSGTGHFTKRLISSRNVLVTAVEIDWACYIYLKDDLEADILNNKLKVVNADSRTYTDPDGPFDFIFSSFADHHINPADKALYFGNIKRNLSPKGVLIVGDEFIPSYDHDSRASFESAVTKYHNHIIAKANGHDKLVELETAAMKSGLEGRGDFKMPCEDYEQCLRNAGLKFKKELIGPKDLDDVGGIYVYVIGNKATVDAEAILKKIET